MDVVGGRNQYFEWWFTNASENGIFIYINNTTSNTKEFEDAFHQLLLRRNLTGVSIGFCSDGFVFPKVITCYPNHITELRCNYMKMRYVPENIGLLTHLKVLEMSHNYITLLPKSIGKCTQLTYLDIINCNLQKLPPTLVYCTFLGQIDTRGNPNIKPLGYDKVFKNMFFMKVFFQMIVLDFTYREARAATLALLVLSRRKTFVIHKDVARSILAPMLYETRDAPQWW